MLKGLGWWTWIEKEIKGAVYKGCKRAVAALGIIPTGN